MAQGTPGQRAAFKYRFGYTHNPKRKLDDDKVREIRRLYSEGSHTQAQLAEMYGVTGPTVYALLHRHTWAGVK
jgi:DNA invertase Pin-like site-specific DNA recombinase